MTKILELPKPKYRSRIAEIPGVNCQEKTLEELKETLRITLIEALEFNRQDALIAVGEGYIEEKIAV